MRSPEHFAINLSLGLTLSHFLANFSWLDLWLLLVGGVVFDIDHIFNYVATERNLNVRKFNAVRIRMYSNMETHVQIFHTLEFLVLLGIVAWQIPSLLYLFVGFVVHVASDWLRAVYHFRRNRKALLNWSKRWILAWDIRHRHDSDSEVGVSG